MTGTAKYIVSISSSDMTGGAANKETKYSLNILIRYDWRSKLIKKQDIVSISSSDMMEEQLIKKQNIVSISSSDMTGGAANKETKYSSISTSDMTGGAANKETKYSLNILIIYDWRSS